MLNYVPGVLCIVLINLSHYVASERFVEVPTGMNGTVLVDLEAKPNLELLAPIGTDTKFMLYTSKNQDDAQYITADDAVTIQNSNFDSSVPTMVLINGWLNQPTINLGSIVRKALLNSSDVNVILVDWTKISQLDYVTANFGVPRVGKQVGQMLQYLNSQTGAPYSSMHLIGHSLGAHVAANAGRTLNGQVARVTGLDPAGPGWLVIGKSKRMRPTDAIYTEAIHTNAALLGIVKYVADVDFYPNGGLSQPGCNVDISCDHGRSIDLFAASITNPNHLVGTKCDNFLQMKLNMCKGSELPLGNNDLKKNGTGVYRLSTGKTYPF